MLSAPIRLSDRRPVLDADRLVAELIPPPRFVDERFATYLPDANQPTQAAARAALDTFAVSLSQPAPKRRGRFRRAPEPPERRPGMYLDGGFGVGKTHLLASLWHAAPQPAAFATFVELTNLVGALGFAETAQRLGTLRLLCIDEFELDDPGDTVLVSSLLGRLVEAGVRLAASSNTLPDRLGEGRFAAQDFLREIQALSAHFDVVRIDGEDFRHRGLPRAPAPVSSEELRARAIAATANASLDTFSDLLHNLSHVHPSRYGALLDGVQEVYLDAVTSISDQAVALRLVVLADRLYDRDVSLLTSGVALDTVFTPELLTGGYRKKYARAVSRLVALSR